MSTLGPDGDVARAGVSSFEQSYAGFLRRFVGDRRVITPGARAVIVDAGDRVLLVRRRDDGSWVMPAGGLELGESVWDCLVAEVREETGLQVLAATPIALYSEPRFWFTNAYGGRHQMLSVVFRVDRWSGELQTQTEETTDARFFSRSGLPDLPPIYAESLRDLDHFDGSLIVK